MSNQARSKRAVAPRCCSLVIHPPFLEGNHHDPASRKRGRVSRRDRRAPRPRHDLIRELSNGLDALWRYDQCIANGGRYPNNGASIALARLQTALGDRRVVATLALPYKPVARPLGFKPIAPAFLLMMATIVACYIAAAEVAKHWFYGRRTSDQPRRPTEDGRIANSTGRPEMSRGG